jgi:hypothetical protein
MKPAAAYKRAHTRAREMTMTDLTPEALERLDLARELSTIEKVQIAGELYRLAPGAKAGKVETHDRLASAGASAHPEKINGVRSFDHTAVGFGNSLKQPRDANRDLR